MITSLQSLLCPNLLHKAIAILFQDSNSLVKQVSLRNCVCFRLLNICFNIKYQKISFTVFNLNSLDQ